MTPYSGLVFGFSGYSARIPRMLTHHSLQCCAEMANQLGWVQQEAAGRRSPVFDSGRSVNGSQVKVPNRPQKINAARASHPGRTARGCLNLPFTAQGSEVC